MAKLLGIIIVILMALFLWYCLSKTGLFNKVGKNALKESNKFKKKWGKY